jgi:hypothetical protein
MSDPHDRHGAPRRALTRWTLTCALLLMPIAAAAQVTLRPTPKPVVTAANEPWYVAGEALTFSDAIFYPAGAQVFFDATEMVRSGSYRGIPLFTLTSREPDSVLFVPVGGGLMQPYERLRADQVAGTFGTSELASLPRDSDGSWATADPDNGAGPRAVSTGGRSAWPEPHGPLTTARTPTGLNAFYIEHDGQRWFAAGKAVLLDPAAFTRAGEYRGFPVYVARGGQPGTIYVSVAGAAEGGLLTPYSLRR